MSYVFTSLQQLHVCVCVCFRPVQVAKVSQLTFGPENARGAIIAIAVYTRSPCPGLDLLFAPDSRIAFLSDSNTFCPTFTLI